MGKKSPHYFTMKVKGKPFTYSVSKVLYRDKKGQFAKFNPRRKLKVEVYAKSTRIDKRTGKQVEYDVRIRKHSLGFAKRKKRSTVEHIQKLILRKAVKSKGQLRVEKQDGIYKFTSDKVVPRNTQRQKGVRTLRINRGSMYEYFKAFKASLSGNSTVS